MKTAPHHFRLYVQTLDPASIELTTMVRQQLTLAFGPTTQLEVIDLQQTPVPSLPDVVLVTPTLIRVSPSPAKRFVGDIHKFALLHTLLLND